MTIRIPDQEKLATKCPRCGAKPGESCVARRPFDCHRMATFHRERREAAIVARRRAGIPTGDCYQAAANYLSRLGPKESEGHTLVHGIVSGQGPLEGKRLDHAWVEAEQPVPGGSLTIVLVIDVSQGKNLLLPRDLYYRIGRVNPAECTRYTPEEAMINMLRSKHFGPWNETEKSS